MRLIYVDEAGTSPAEPVRVVASVVVEADVQFRALASELDRIFDERVPSKIREGFIFHAMEVFNGGKTIKREDWAFEDRLDFIKEILSLPLVHDVPIGLGITFAGYYDSFRSSSKRKAEIVLGSDYKVSTTTFEHAMAFAKCIERSDVFLRKYLDGRENGIVIAENINTKKSFIQKLALFHRIVPMELTPDLLLQDALEAATGKPVEGVTLEVKNIIDVPHFVEKSAAPMLQLADACAFSFRRFLSKQKFGDELCLAMLGPREGNNFINDPVWFTGGSSGLFNTFAHWSDEQKEKLRIPAHLVAKIPPSLRQG